MLIALAIIFWIGVTCWHFYRGHYLLCVFVGLFGCYEFAGPSLLMLAAGWSDEQNAYLRLVNRDIVSGFVGALIIFLTLVHLAYSLTSRISLRQTVTAPTLPDRPALFALLAVVVSIFGLISVYYQAGQTRLLDYVGQEPRTTPVFSYGATLLVTVMAGVFFQLERRKWAHGLALLLLVSPLAHEIFISSRRQLFAPSVLLALLVILYSARRRLRKLTLVSTIATAMLAVFGAQHWVRNDYILGEAAADIAEAFLIPQLGEFLAIGSTTFSAWNDYAIGHQGDQITGGTHLIFHALNAIPFIKVGDLVFPSYADDLFQTYRVIAPWGGLSILADAFLSFGLVGLFVLPMLVGVMLRVWHGHLMTYLARGIRLNERSVYILSLICTVVLKYRSGLGDIVQAVIGLSILYWSFLILGSLLLNMMRSGYAYTEVRSRG